jgi:threonine/homoserine/homoserine lactone efflux protein
MIPVSHVLAFAAVAAVLIAVPGPSVLFTVSRAVTVGRRAAMFSVVGNELGLVVQVVAVAFGAGALVQQSAEVFTAIKLAGAVYLVYLGVQAIRHRQSMAVALAGKLPPVTGGRSLRDGFMVVSGPGSLPVPAQMIILGMLFPVIALVLDSVWAAAAGTARQWFARSPRRLALVGGTGGLVMIGLGISLAATGRNE